MKRRPPKLTPLEVSPEDAGVGSSHPVPPSPSEAVASLAQVSAALGQRAGISGENLPCVDDLRVLARLGEGASSSVWLVQDPKTGRYFALKSIRVFDENLRRMLTAELSSLFRNDSEALIDLYGVGYREGCVSLVLELFDSPLDVMLRALSGGRTPGDTSPLVPERTLAAMAFQIFYGLAYLSFERRLHRDLKAANILLDSRSGRVVLTDFGLSKDVGTAVIAQTYVGSFAYMSPERIAHGTYTTSADVWSAGIVLIECILGCHPFQAHATSQIGLLLSVAEGESPSAALDSYPPSAVSPVLRSFIDACTTRRPEARLTAVDALEHDLFQRSGIDSLETAWGVVAEWFNTSGVGPLLQGRLSRAIQGQDSAVGETVGQEHEGETAPPLPKSDLAVLRG